MTLRGPNFAFVMELTPMPIFNFKWFALQKKIKSMTLFQLFMRKILMYGKIISIIFYSTV